MTRSSIVKASLFLLVVSPSLVMAGESSKKGKNENFEKPKNIKTMSVPEPSSIALLALGLSGLMLRQLSANRKV